MGVSENGINVIYVSISDTPGPSGRLLFVLFIGYTWIYHTPNIPHADNGDPMDLAVHYFQRNPGSHSADAANPLPWLVIGYQPFKRGQKTATWQHMFKSN
jgi:hypothetical protein